MSETFAHHWSVHIITNVITYFKENRSFLICTTHTHILSFTFNLFNNWCSWLTYMTFSSSPLVNLGFWRSSAYLYAFGSLCPGVTVCPHLLLSFLSYSFLIVIFCLINFILQVFSFKFSDLGHWNVNISTLTKVFLCSTPMELCFGEARLNLGWLQLCLLFYTFHS